MQPSQQPRREAPEVLQTEVFANNVVAETRRNSRAVRRGFASFLVVIAALFVAAVLGVVELTPSAWVAIVVVVIGVVATCVKYLAPTRES